MTTLQQQAQKISQKKTKIQRKKSQLERDLPNLVSISVSLTGKELMVRLKNKVTVKSLEKIQKNGFRVRSIALNRSTIYLLVEAV